MSKKGNYIGGSSIINNGFTTFDPAEAPKSKKIKFLGLEKNTKYI